ncbi:MAG TPA: hypothetical protein VGQ76_05755 [Thermoanaerobaculia bacterium]|jgi:hypothetical protein|nr:hypothetical protein [Thermoanaerobaculia bacterium]
MRGTSCLIAVCLLIPLLWPLLGGEQLFLRDIGTTHRPAWAAFPEVGFSTINPAASFGQPYRSNPNLLIFYPFPKSARAVEVHVVLHFILLGVGMAFWLSRDLRMLSAVIGAVAFCLSGYVVSAATSINAFTTIAWFPWVFLAASMKRRGYGPLFLQTGAVALFSLSGEPVLIAAGLVLATLLAWRAGTIGSFAPAAIAALLITFPLHRETFVMARESSRVMFGYTSEQALGFSLHPARLLETVLPGIFGSPSHIVGGGWWGYEVSRGTRPYVYSTTLGLIPLVLVITLAFLDRMRNHRGWWAVLFTTCLVSMSGYIPGVSVLWEAIPAIHAIRFPIKAFVFSTLAFAVLTAHAVERISNAEKAKTSSAALLIALCGLLAFGAAFQHERIADVLVRAWWNPAWQSSSSVVFEPIARTITPRLLGAAATLILLFLWISRPKHVVLQVLLVAALAIDLTFAAQTVLPTTRIPPSDSPIVRRALLIPGRVFERASKDLDPVRDGLYGQYPADDARWLAVAQQRQAWSLYGAMSGIRYAYDRSPDGSYTWRNKVVQDYLEQAPWPARVKWLRSAGVGSVIASDITGPIPGLRSLLHDEEIGIPVTLYAIEPRLAELRAPRNIRWVETPAQGITTVLLTDFDEKSEVTMEGVPEQKGQPTIALYELSNEPDRVTFRSHGAHSGFVFLARSYTRSVHAAASGKALRVVPANAHLCGIEVPAGNHIITVTF